MLGFSTISISNYPNINWIEILDKFEYFDISPLHISLIPSDKVFSMQGIFYGKDITNSSLVKTNEEYKKLKSIFKEVLELSNNNGIGSIIWGAPSTRTGIEVSKEVAIQRALELIRMAEIAKVKLYFEALSNTLCDFLNSHAELIELHKLSGIGGIHFDICTALIQNEGINFVKTNSEFIERFHLSENGYSLAVLKNTNAMIIYKQLKEYKIKGTLEVQDFNLLNTKQIINILKIVNIH